MLTAILSREEAAHARAEAAMTRAQDIQKREGGVLPSFVKAERDNPPRDIGLERRTDFKANVLRATPEKRNGIDMIHVEGHASVVDTPYEMWDMFGPYTEIVAGTAFDNTLAAGPDVVFVVNHTGLTMARTIAPADKVPTLELEMGVLGEYNGLLSNAWLNPTREDIRALVTAIDNGLITEMSFRFMIVHGRWSDDWMQYTISEVDIDRGDVSAVNYGANPFTTISARMREWMAMSDAMPLGAKLAMGERLAAQVDVRSWYEGRQPMPVRGKPTGRSLEDVAGQWGLPVLQS